MRITLLDIPIDALSQHEALLKISGFFKAKGQFHIATPNPEMLVEAQKNTAFKEVLQQTALNLPDGTGLLWAAKRKGSPLPERITGTDTLQALCSLDLRICPPEQIFLLGAAPGVAEKASAVLRQKNPMLRIVGTHAGSPRAEEEEEIIQKINAAQPTLLFIAFGAPQQDLWIARNLSKLRTVKVAMGVGGAFDFIIGKQKRAPQVMRRMGIEWLWRLIREPRRAGRIWNAVIVFPWMMIRTKGLS